MAVRTEEAIRTAEALLGTPYGSGKGELDCINLIKQIIRTGAGGVKGYTTAGTNALWNSRNASAKYRDLTWTQERTQGMRPGMLVFKRDGEDVHHVGLAVGTDEIIHASSAAGSVVRSRLNGQWALLAVHRYIEAAQGGQDAVQGGQDAAQDGQNAAQGVPFAGIVCARGGLRQRETPGGRYMQMIPDGSAVMVEETRGEWGRVEWMDFTGWVHLNYVCRKGDD